MDDESPERLGPHGSMGHCGRGPHAPGLAPKTGDEPMVVELFA